MDYPKVNKIYWFGLAVMAIFTVMAWLAVSSLRPSDSVSVAFYDIGQGDAAFITSPRHLQILIDGGPDSKIMQKLGREMPFFDRTIDLVILTHPHADHLNGLIEVLDKYQVGKVLATAATNDTAGYRKFRQVIEQKHIRVIEARAGQKIILDSGAVLQILYPFQSLVGQKQADLNETSIISRLLYGRDSFLFMGDAPQAEELEVFNSGQAVAAEVLKIGHHGSRSATGQQFLEAVHPAYAVISVGKKNRYGHPHQETLDVLATEKIKYFRTDQDGDVRFTADGHNLIKL